MKKVNHTGIASRMSLWKFAGLRLGILALILLIISGGGWFYYKSAVNSARHSASETLNSISDLKVSQIVQYMKERRADIRIASGSRLFHRYLARPEAPALREEALEWMNNIRQTYDYHAVVLFDAKGAELLSAPAGAVSRHTWLTGHVKAALQSGEILFSDLQRTGDDGTLHMCFVAPLEIASPAGSQHATSVDGALVLLIDPERAFYPLVKSWPTPSTTGEALLVRREGDSVVFLNELRHRANSALVMKLSVESNPHIPAVIAALGKEGPIEGEDYRGVPVHSVIRRVTDTPWFLVVKQDQEEIFAYVRLQARAILFIVSLLLVIAILGFTLMLHQQRVLFLKRDLAGRAAAEDALRESERTYRDTVENLGEGLYNATLEGVLLDHNKSFNRIFGFDPGQDLRGLLISGFWQNPEARNEYIQSLSATGVVNQYQIEAKTHRGDPITVIVSSRLVKDSDDQAPYIKGFILDVSDRVRAEEALRKTLDLADRSRRALLSAYEDLKRSETALRNFNAELDRRVHERTAQLEASNKELEAFSHSVSHDLRAPLRAINGFSQMLAEECANQLNEEGRRLLGVISGETKRMGKLVDDLLAFSRLSRQDAASVRVDLSALANDIYRELIRLVPERVIQFECLPLPDVLGDPAMLRVALTNLLSNAIKFTGPRNPALIEMGSLVKNDQTVYYIKDNGVGFDMKYVDKLFGVFQRLHSVKEFEGTGIGLSLVQRVVQRHGGQVWAESEVDKGTTIFFTIINTRTETDPGAHHPASGTPPAAKITSDK